MIDLVENASYVLLPIVVTALAVMPFAGHIPILAALTGAAELQDEDHTDLLEDPARDRQAAGRITVPGAHADASAAVAVAAAGRRLNLPPESEGDPA